MNKNFSIVVIFCLLSSSVLLGQKSIRGFCATEGAAFLPRLAENIQQIEYTTVTERMTKYIPITWHIIGKNDGSGRVTMKKILEQMCALNEDFEVVDFHFYIKNIKYLNNTSIYENSLIGVNNGTFNTRRDNTSLNVFVANNAIPPNFDPSSGGVILGYYDPLPNRDWLVIKRSEISATNSTLPHEVGHFFSLEHTFYGWEEAYSPNQHGTPAPFFSPGGQRTEFMNGTNCSVAADLICDTPPDYNFGFSTAGCNYNGGARDPNNELVNPMEENFMSYFLGCHRDDYAFTPMQIQAMKADYNQPFRAYLRSNYVPNHNAFDRPDLERPIDGTTTSTYDKITFEWENVPGATHFFFELDRIPGFSANLGTSMVVEDHKLTIENSSNFAFEPNKQYFWRVTPYSEGYFCASTTGTENFTTGLASSISNLDIVDEWSVFPNPVQNAQQLSLQIRSSSQLDADFYLYNLMGQSIKFFGKKTIEFGNNNFELAINDLSAGVYTLVLQTQKGVLKQRIVVTK